MLTDAWMRRWATKERTVGARLVSFPSGNGARTRFKPALKRSTPVNRKGPVHISPMTASDKALLLSTLFTEARSE